MTSTFTIQFQNSQVLYIYGSLSLIRKDTFK
ncbi:hypothetical protein T12_14895 [Trichinella patagoniensis]|uniref:Uncharacterized protein n=1 Tax=Trichinella patagoniensis TaxID=990121 RepID=A0A0V0YRM9_9BILA|nr:hypothetical protein T12_14895 [Trichinella patagoniensis]